MKTPTQQQLNDPAWWDENAPECATHYSPNRKEFVMAGEGWAYGIDNKYKSLERLVYPKQPERIPRPTKPQAPEWDGDLPAAGVECEILGTPEGSWSVGEIDYIDGRHCIWHWKLRPGDTMHNRVNNMKFRPIRTKEQRELEELNNIIDAAMRSGDGDAAAAIIAAGWHK